VKFGASSVFCEFRRTINTSLLEGLHAELIAGESVNTAPLDTLEVDAVTVPEP
jgi:hypothetical protein